MTILALLPALAVPLVALGGAAAAWLVLFPHAPEDLGGAANLDGRAERVRIPLPDGDAIDGWFLAGRGHGALLLLHGFGRTHARMWRYGGFLNDAGYALLAIDFRSSRRRRRKPTTLGAHEVIEAQAALAWLRARVAPDAPPIGIMGESLGGSVALVLAARDPDVAAVVVDGAFAHGGQVLEDTCARWARLPGRPTAALLRWIGRGVTGHDPGGLDVAAEAVALTGRPVLLIHALEDDRLSPAHPVALWRATGAKDPLWMIHGAGHNEGWAYQRTLYEETVLAFLAPPLQGSGAGLPGGLRASAVVRRRGTRSAGVASARALSSLAGVRRRRQPPAA